MLFKMVICAKDDLCFGEIMSNFFDSSQFNEVENTLIAKGIKPELLVALHEKVQTAIVELGYPMPVLKTMVKNSMKFVRNLFDPNYIDSDAGTDKILLCAIYKYEVITPCFMTLQDGYWNSDLELEKSKEVGEVILSIFEHAEELIEEPSLTMGL